MQIRALVHILACAFVAAGSGSCSLGVSVSDLARAIADRALERGRLITLDGPSQRTRHLESDPLEYSELQAVRSSGRNSAEVLEPACGAPCPSGEVAGTSCQSPRPCGSVSCPAGAVCCNGRCCAAGASCCAGSCYEPCPPGQARGLDDCRCHRRCGSGYCPPDSECCRGSCHWSCPGGQVLGVDCSCQTPGGSGKSAPGGKYCKERRYDPCGAGLVRRPVRLSVSSSM